MDLHLIAFSLMSAQACLGAFDTLYHHELTEGLARRPTAVVPEKAEAASSIKAGWRC